MNMGGTQGKGRGSAGGSGREDEDGRCEEQLEDMEEILHRMGKG